MDLVEGQPPAPAAELRRTGLDPQRVLQTGARAVLRQIFEFGLFHADPHPGNLLVLPGSGSPSSTSACSGGWTAVSATGWASCCGR
ncbi:AarF/UbiB family protein [Streptomyces mirabilis]|uniref:AarF/UbiB family protein n=1 Tax=Streptomyces mirabilis TaxID=68239 RepID=UPI003BEED245